MKPAVSATDLILRLIEHEVPRYGLLHLLDLPQERLEIIEIEVLPGSPAAGKMVKEIGVPEGSLVISILRDGTGFVPLADSVVEAGDEVLLVLDTGLEDKITARFARAWPFPQLTLHPHPQTGATAAPRRRASREATTRSS